MALQFEKHHFSKMEGTKCDALAMNETLGLFVLCNESHEGACSKTPRAVADEFLLQAGTWSHLIRAYVQEPVKKKRRLVMNAIEQSLQTINLELYSSRRQKEEGNVGGLSMDVLLLLGDYAITAHIGDTRTYLLQGEHFFQMTKDHTYFNQWIEKKVCPPQEAQKRIGAQQLYAALGKDPHAETQYQEHLILPGDRFYLTTRGVSAAFPNTKLLALVNSSTWDNLQDLLVPELSRSTQKNTGTMLGIGILVAQTLKTADSRALQLLSRYQAIQKSNLFSTLSQDEALSIISVAETRQFLPGEVMIQEGSSGTDLFLILTGKVEVKSKGVLRNQCGHGDMIGEMSAFDPSPRSATVTAVQPTVAMAWERDDLLELMEKDHLLAKKIYEAVIRELVNRQKRREGN